jgi:hypothetical protein
MNLEQEVKEKASQTQQIELKIRELENVERICKNATNLIAEMEVKGAYAKPVAEVIDWLMGITQTLKTQIDPLKALLPKESVQPTVVDVPEIK